MFLAAIILNPYMKTYPFKKDYTLISPAVVTDLMENLWERFYPGESSEGLHRAVRDYLKGDGVFASMG